MAKITVQPDCGNAPKKEFIRDFEVAFAEKNPEVILKSMDENIHWEIVGQQTTQGRKAVEAMLPTMLDGSMEELTIETIITHGDTGSVNGIMKFVDGSRFGFCDVFTFTAHGKDAKIKKLQAYIVPMDQDTTSQVVSVEKYKELLDSVVQKIQADTSFHPDTILALSTGGFPVAAAIAKRLGIKSRNVVGIPVYRDETGDYHLDDRLVLLGDFSNRQVLVIDEASKRGFLTRKAVDAVVEKSGVAKSCVLIAWKNGIQPDFVAETCSGEPPDFYWEY